MSQDKEINVGVGNAVKSFDYAFKQACLKTEPVVNMYDERLVDNDAARKQIAEFINHKYGFRSKIGEQIKPDNISLFNGTLHAWSKVLSDIADRNELINKYSDQPKAPIIVTPVPTYGLFLETAKQMGFEVLEVQREDDGSVSPDRLREGLDKIDRMPNKRASIYYDSNPNNPTGHIREEQETADLAEVIASMSEKLKDEMFHVKRKVDNDDFVKALSFDGGITIVDDMIYLGTELVKKEPFSFVDIESTSQDTFILAGISKIGLAALRGGF